jgi:hypothetical protein
LPKSKNGEGFTIKRGLDYHPTWTAIGFCEWVSFAWVTESEYSKLKKFKPNMELCSAVLIDIKKGAVIGSCFIVSIILHNGCN